MAVFREKCGGVVIEIYDVDHGPPHCHVIGLSERGGVVVSLFTLQVTKPGVFPLPRAVRRCLKESQERMLAAWDRVARFPDGRE